MALILKSVSDLIDNPVCTRDMLLAAMLHHWKQKTRPLVSLKRLFLQTFFKHICVAHAERNPVTLQKLCGPVVFSKKCVNEEAAEMW